MSEKMKSLTAGSSDPELFPSWFVRSLVFSRAITMLFLATLFFLVLYLRDMAPIIISKCVKTSTPGVFQGIMVFRILNNLYIPLILFFATLACCYLIDLLFRKQNKSWIHISVLVILSYLVFNFLFFKLPIYYIFIYSIIGVAALKLNTLNLKRIIETNGSLRYLVLIFFILLPFIAELIFPSFPLFLLRNSKMKISNFFRRGLWDKFVLYTTIGISANILIWAFTFYGIGRNISQESISEALFRKAERIAEGNFCSMQIDAANKRLFACDIGHYSLNVFDLSGSNVSLKTIKRIFEAIPIYLEASP